MYPTGETQRDVCLDHTFGCGGPVMENTWWRGGWWRMNPPAVPFASCRPPIS